MRLVEWQFCPPLAIKPWFYLTTNKCPPNFVWGELWCGWLFWEFRFMGRIEEEKVSDA